MLWGSKAVQDSLRRPKKAPKRHLKSSKTSKNRGPKVDLILTNCGTTFGAILESILESKSAQKGTRNGTTFGTRFPRVIGPRELPEREINERGERSQAAGFICRKRKGGIRLLWRLIRPFNVANGLIKYPPLEFKTDLPSAAILDFINMF